MRRQSGFSLVELMVAMTVTLIVSTAIYGLLTSGSNAFRREPELADRQQNIRVAMDSISRDVFNAGAALPTFSQVFTIGDPSGDCMGGLDGCGIPGAIDAAEDSDVLELVTTSEDCLEQSVCSPVAGIGAAGLYVTRQPTPGCLRLPGLALVARNDYFSVHTAAVGGGAGITYCPGVASGANGNVELGASLGDWTWGGSGTEANVFLYGARIVRYRLGPGSDLGDTAPALWRSVTGRYATDGSVPPEPDEGSFPGSPSPWQLVATGIEDLQVEYMYLDESTDTEVWGDAPPVSILPAPGTAPTDAHWSTLVRQVRITLSARARTGANLQGATETAGAGPDAIRGQLSTIVAPRAAIYELQIGGKIR